MTITERTAGETLLTIAFCLFIGGPDLTLKCRPYKLNVSLRPETDR